MESLSIENENIVHFFILAVDKVAKSSDKKSEKFKLTQPIFKLISIIFYKYIEEKNYDVGIEYVPGKKEDDDDFIIITKITRSEKN